ncbi:hypothetical protein V1511DRAFT_495650 [Dipodascopsis uninucleata]
MESNASPTKCHPEACAIQNCLQRSQYNERRCTAAIDSLYECCRKMYEQDPSARAIACPKPDLLKLKLEQRAKEKIDAELHKTNYR